MFSGRHVADAIQAYMSVKNPSNDLEFVVGPELPEMPDDLVMVTLTAGAGTSMEEIADSPGIQIVVRGMQEYPDLDLDGPLRWAMQIDHYMRLESFPSEDWGDYVFQVSRAGGAPTQLSPADDARRIIYTCNYIPTLIMEAV